MTAPIKIAAIVAMDEGRVIGAHNAIPWHIPEDLKRFSALTKHHTVLMGRKTYESLPEKFRPLPQRKNVVFSRTPHSLLVSQGVLVVDSPERFIAQCRNREITLPSDLLWIIGGAMLYAETMPLWDELYLTLVHSRYDGDAFFPQFEDSFECISREPHATFSYLTYKRVGSKKQD